jgi:2-dehydropantoate 2-reductase
MKIAVFGSGAVGSYFGGRLAAAGEDVHFLARGPQLAALRRDGLTVVSPTGDLRLKSVKAIDRPVDIGAVDIVLFAVKLYDAEAAAAALAPLIGPDTAVITVQNGVDAVETVSRHVRREHVVAGAAYIMAAVEAPGRIRHTAKDTLLFGESDGSRSTRLTSFEAACQHAGFSATLSTNIDRDLWTKFVRLATWSGMTTVTRSPMGVIRNSPSLMAMMAAALDEAITVGYARGVSLPTSLPEETLTLVNSFPDGAKSSMLEDLEHGRRLELPWLSGAVARMGREAGVPTPVHQFIATVLEPFVAGGGGGGSRLDST